MAIPSYNRVQQAFTSATADGVDKVSRAISQMKVLAEMASIEEPKPKTANAKELSSVMSLLALKGHTIAKAQGDGVLPTPQTCLSPTFDEFECEAGCLQGLYEFVAVS